MTKPIDDNLHTDLPLRSTSAGRYDKLQEAGMATGFVKGVSGVPNGRPKNPHINLPSYGELLRNLK